MMMLYKPDMKQYRIHDVKIKKTGFPFFLIYRNGQWVYRSAKYFVPVGHYFEDGSGGYVIDE